MIRKWQVLWNIYIQKYSSSVFTPIYIKKYFFGVVLSVIQKLPCYYIFLSKSVPSKGYKDQHRHILLALYIQVL